MADMQDAKFGAGFEPVVGEVPHHAVTTQAGVNKVEAANAVWGKTSKAFLFVGVAIIAYIYSLDGTTTYLYQALATSSFSDHAALSTIAVAQAIILALSKPISAKISDVFGRAEAFTVAVIFYVVGFIVVASSSAISAYGAGAVIYYIGYASVQILIQILIADLTTLRWRTLVAQLVSLPFFINAFVSGNIAQGIIASSGWRWGYGMFCIIIPAGAAPIITTLFWAQRKAKKLGVSATDYHGHGTGIAPKTHLSPFKRVAAIFTEMDTFGLLLLGFGFALVLIPLTVVNNATSRWSSPSIIAMIVLGFVILIVAFFYEGWFARLPVIPGRFMRNATVLAACFINFFDFVSFYLQFTYQYSFIYVTKDWALKDQGYFAYTQTLALTLFAILSGFFVLRFRRAKWLLVAGLCVRLLGVGLMIRSKGANGSTAELVIVQIIQGAGGGIAAATTQTLAQAVVPHQDVGAVTAAVLLFAEIGGAVGTAIAGAIWRNSMPNQLALRLNGELTQAEITGIFQSITTAATYPMGSPIRQGVIGAYTYVMKLILIPATVLAIIPIIASLFMKNVYLGETQNAVEDVGETGDIPTGPDMANKKV